MSANQTHTSDSVIRVLSQELANKIAAGEVVERPAAVVKELLDNSIDAGADAIQILIKNAGKQLIQIVDNGCGMSKEDLRLCFQRHATSKISHVDDLYNIHTLGFRGEAMASIGSVAQITLKSRRHEDDAGWEMELWGGEERNLIPAAMEPGTSVSVRNLFFNVPARRSFLKTDATELRHIIIAVQQAALAHPDIAFELTDSSETIYKLAPSSLADRIAGIFGKSYKKSLIPVQEETSLLSVHGYIIDPKMTRKNRGEQFLFVNGRPFMHRHLNYIIHQIYRDWSPGESYPFYALFFDVEPSKVDVNVHPTKLEVKFDDERSVSTLTRSIVKRALNERFNVPALREEEDDGQDSAFKKIFGGGFGRQDESFPRQDTGGIRHPDFPRSRRPLAGLTESLYGDSGSIPETGTGAEPVAPSRLHDRNRGFWQLHDQYIVSQTRTGMFIVDQYAAHKRIIFEKALSSTDSGLPSTQQLLFPQTIDFSASDFELLREVLPNLKKIGFNIQLLSGNSAIVSGVPADLNHGDEKPIIESILHQYQNYSGPVKLDAREKLVMAYASKAAIPRGKRLMQPEMESLIDQLFACENPFFDPLNRPTTFFIPLEDIHKRFR